MNQLKRVFHNFFKRTKLWNFMSILIGLMWIGIVILWGVLINSFFNNDKTIPSIEKYRIEFFQLADELLTRKDTASLNIETLKFAFNSINRESNNKLLNYGFVNTLEDYLVYLISNKKIRKDAHYYNTLIIIKKEIELEPFSQLPSDQRRVLKNLELSINKQDSTSSKYNLVEINDILLNSNSKILSLQKQNNWSLPLAILGIVISLLFGIITILSPFSNRKMKKIIDESLHPK